ncbi:FmdB family zinc ribbon protein [Thermodesulfobacteriota bacterium]
MPIYEYECSKCGEVTEAWQKFSDNPLTQCERCHGELKKIISQNSFHLKGSGWYVTDYASKSGGYDGKNSSSEAKTDKAETKSSADSNKKKDSSDGGSKADNGSTG